MQNVIALRRLSIGIAAVLVVAAAGSTLAVFEASRPGANLAPVDHSDDAISIVQGGESILWTALEGSVRTVTVRGWPTVIDGNELGGAIVVERPDSGVAGAINFGEKPMRAEFDLAP